MLSTISCGLSSAIFNTAESKLHKAEYTGIIVMLSKQVGYFAVIGIDAETVSMTRESNIPVDGIFRANVPKDKAVELTTKWRKYLGKDKLVGNWNELMADIL